MLKICEMHDIMCFCSLLLLFWLCPLSLSSHHSIFPSAPTHTSGKETNTHTQFKKKRIRKRRYNNFNWTKVFVEWTHLRSLYFFLIFSTLALFVRMHAISSIRFSCLILFHPTLFTPRYTLAFYCYCCCCCCYWWWWGWCCCCHYYYCECYVAVCLYTL